MKEATRENGAGVVCLFCGIETEIVRRARHGQPDHPAGLIVRCEHCGKESRYLASEICDFPKLASGDSLRLRVSGTRGSEA